MTSSAEDHPTMDSKKEPKEPTDSNDAVPAASIGGATKDDEDERPSDSAQPSAKKRRSNIQLNKDDHPEGHTCNSDDDGDLNEEGGKRSDPFKRASDNVIQKRKIVKASGKWGSGGNGGSNGGGAFASVKLANTATEKTEKDAVTSVFGSGTKVPAFGSTTGSTGFGAAAKSGGFGSGFGAVSSGFGALKPTSSTDKADSNNVDANSSSSKSTGFGGGFGAVSTGFGSLKSSTYSFSFGAAPNGNAAPSPNNAAAKSNSSGLAGTFAKSPSKSSNASPSKFPTSSVVDTANGEQDEDCLCQVRAKLFKMVPEDEAADTPEDTSASKGDVPSVPSTAGRMKLSKAKEEDEEGSNESPEKASQPTTAGGEEDKKQKLVQKEAGIGPVRILKRKPPIVLGGEEEEAAKELPTARVVQRQETSGGQGTKVILNVRLIPKTCSVIRRGDKFVQLNAPNSDGTLETSLFMVKLASEADTLEESLKAILDVPGEDVPAAVINH